MVDKTGSAAEESNSNNERDNIRDLEQDLGMTPSIWPIDVSTLNKGDVLSVDRLEEITGLTRGTSVFQMAVLQLIKFIMGELYKTNRPAVVCQQGGCVCVLTDAEALEYNQRLHDRGLRTARRGHFMQCQVDVSNLSPDEINTLDRSLQVMGATIAAMGAARRQAKISYSNDREDRPRGLPPQA